LLKLTLSCLFVLGTSTGLVAEQNRAPGRTVEVPRIEMRLVETDHGTMVEVLSDLRLVSPRIEYVCGEWVECHNPVAENGKLAYRAKRYYAPTPDTLFSVASEAPDKAMEFRASYAFRHGGKDRKDPVMLETVKPNALVAVAFDPAGPDAVLRVINRWRAQLPMIPRLQPFPRRTMRWAEYMPTRATVARRGLAFQTPSPPCRCG
jgi:hypothetical protein